MTGTSALTASAAGALRRTRKNRRVDVTELNRVCLFVFFVSSSKTQSFHFTALIGSRSGQRSKTFFLQRPLMVDRTIVDGI